MNNERLMRLVGEIKQHGIDRILISNPKSIAYFTDIVVEPGERLYVLMMDDSGNCKLFLNNLFKSSVNTTIEIVSYDDTDPCLEILKGYVGNKETIGVDGQWPARFLLPFQKMLPQCQFVNGSETVDHIRRIKDGQEQQKMIVASKINDEVIAETISIANEQFSELQIAQRIKQMYLDKGCSGNSFDSIVSFGRNAADPHHEPDETKGKQGDCVVIDIGGIYDGYCSDMTRTVFLGQVSEKAKEIYNIVLKANKAGIAAAKVGNRMCDVDKAARDVIEQAGYGAYFTHRTGHSIGSEVHESGDVSKINTAPIEVGQVFSVEPGIYIPQENIGVRIEDLVLITEEGCRVLNNYTKELQVLPFESKK